MPCRCIAEGCSVTAHYSFPGHPARFCVKHKAEGMVPKSKRALCCVDGCSTLPSYSYPDQPCRTHCASHKLKGMTRKSKQAVCAAEGCSVNPHFGFPDTPGSSHCAVHKLEGMIHKCKSTCEAPNCGKQPCFGLPGFKPSRCAPHRLAGMFNWTRKCSDKSCNKRSRFGAQDDDSPSVCGLHKTAATPRDFKRRLKPVVRAHPTSDGSGSELGKTADAGASMGLPQKPPEGMGKVEAQAHQAQVAQADGSQGAGKEEVDITGRGPRGGRGRVMGGMNMAYAAGPAADQNGGGTGERPHGERERPRLDWSGMSEPGPGAGAGAFGMGHQGAVSPRDVREHMGMEEMRGWGAGGRAMHPYRMREGYPAYGMGEGYPPYPMARGHGLWLPPSHQGPGMPPPYHGYGMPPHAHQQLWTPPYMMGDGVGMPPMPREQGYWRPPHPHAHGHNLSPRHTGFIQEGAAGTEAMEAVGRREGYEESALEWRARSAAAAQAPTSTSASESGAGQGQGRAGVAQERADAAAAAAAVPRRGLSQLWEACTHLGHYSEEGRSQSGDSGGGGSGGGGDT
ncbi:unnamed protein product [Chrysoparadoxa australica]